MPLKLNISENGRAWRLEIEGESLAGKSLGDSIDGKELKPDFEGYDFIISGGSDLAGFPMSHSVEGLGLKTMLLKKGWGMRDNRRGVRLRKTVRGKIISSSTSLINLKVVKSGKKPMAEIFPEQNKPKEKTPKKEPNAS